MHPQDLQRTAYTVECFLNARRLKDDHLFYHNGAVCHYSNGSRVSQFDVPRARQTKTLRCNAAKLSTAQLSARMPN